MSNLFFIAYYYANTANATDTTAQNVNDLISSDAALSALITTLIFVVGIFINILIKKYEKRNELVLYKKLITIWIKNSQTSIDQFISSLKNFASDIKENDNLNIAQYTTNLICFDRLNDISINKITDALIINIANKSKNSDPVTNMYNLLTQVEFIEKNSVEIRSVYEKYCIENQKIMDEWNDNYLNFRNAMKSFNNNNINEKELFFSEKIYSCINPIIISQSERPLEEYPISKWKSNFVDPILSYFTTDVDFIKSEKIITVVMNISNLRIAILKHEKLNTFGDVFAGMCQCMIDSKKILFESCDYFEKKNIRNLFFIR